MLVVVQRQVLIYGIGFIMIKYRYDQLAFSSVTANFINIATLTNVISCSGTLANDSGTNFSVTVNLPNNTSFSDIYLVNQNTGNKSYIFNDTTSIDSIWQYVSSETVQLSNTYNANSAVIVISVGNRTGSTITLINQIYTVETIVYNIPF